MSNQSNGGTSIPGEERSAHFSPSYGEVLKEVAISTKNLVQSEVNLVSAEIKNTAERASSHITQAVVFGALLALSVLPFLAFLVIGLGELMGDRYWLSSLIVAVVCAGVGGSMAYRAYKKLTERDLKMPASRTGLNLGRDIAEDKINDVTAAAKGERYGSTPNPQYH